MFFFFFFQAEDGIRDGRVTGVQTCALPIFHLRTRKIYPTSLNWSTFPYRTNICRRSRACSGLVSPGSAANSFFASRRARSEERRVGKECRAGRWRERRKQKKGMRARGV